MFTYLNRIGDGTLPDNTLFKDWIQLLMVLKNDINACILKYHMSGKKSSHR